MVHSYNTAPAQKFIAKRIPKLPQFLHIVATFLCEVCLRCTIPRLDENSCFCLTFRCDRWSWNIPSTSNHTSLLSWRSWYHAGLFSSAIFDLKRVGFPKVLFFSFFTGADFQRGNANGNLNTQEVSAFQSYFCGFSNSYLGNCAFVTRQQVKGNQNCVCSWVMLISWCLSGTSAPRILLYFIYHLVHLEKLPFHLRPNYNIPAFCSHSSLFLPQQPSIGSLTAFQYIFFNLTWTKNVSSHSHLNSNGIRTFTESCKVHGWKEYV